MSAGAWLAVACVALILGALFATLQLALRETSRSAIEDRARRRGRTERIARIIEDPEAHAVSLALPRTVFLLLFVVVLVRWLALTSGQDTAGWFHILLGVLLAGVLAWASAGVLAMSIARHAGPVVVCASWRLIRAVHVLLSPTRTFAAFLDEVVRRLAGGADANGAERIEEEIRSVVEEGEREGHIDERAGEMLEKVVEFSQRTVEEIMTPRTEIEALACTDDLDQVLRFVTECGHSRIPVYREDLDHIAGILYAKDLLIWLSKHDRSEAFSLGSILRPATFVPETKTVSELLGELLAHRVHLAIAADEYGGTAGLVTIEDIVEEIFGEIEDEYECNDNKRPSVDVDPERCVAEVDARKRIDEANELLESIGIELPEGEDYDTVGGLVAVTTGRIPQAGQSIELDGARVTVLEAEATRVRRVRVERLNPDDADAGAAAHSQAGP